MDDEGRGILGDPNATGEQIRKVWERVALAAIEHHQKSGVPVATWDWENGRVVLLPAAEISIPGEQSFAVAISSDRQDTVRS